MVINVSAEERIKLQSKTFREMIESYSRSWQQIKVVKENKKWIEQEKILQILADFKLVPLKEWRELLKLLTTFPKIRYTNGELNIMGLNFLEDHLEKIEEKLEEIKK